MGDEHSIYTTVVMSSFSATVKKIEQQPMPCTSGNCGPNPQGGLKSITMNPLGLLGLVRYKHLGLHSFTLQIFAVLIRV